ncbi:MAG: response regulator [Verrucomicrobiaceae bacterium]|nr:response regulator [Verrucomicrobiaceae bacterium]
MSARTASATPPPAARPRILIASEEDADVSCIVDLLAEMDFEPECVWNGLLALELVMEERIDVLVVAPRLSYLDGCSLVRLLRRFGRMTPVVMMCGAADARALPADVRAQVDCVLDDPLPAGKLIGEVDRMSRMTGTNRTPDIHRCGACRFAAVLETADTAATS